MVEFDSKRECDLIVHCVINELIKSPNAVAGGSDSDSGEAWGAIPSGPLGLLQGIGKLARVLEMIEKPGKFER